MNSQLATVGENLERDEGRDCKFIGPMIVYAWMQMIDINNDHVSDCFRRAGTPEWTADLKELHRKLFSFTIAHFRASVLR